MLRKMIASFFLLAFLSLTGFLIYSALQPERFPIGSALPRLEYQTANGTETLKTDSLQNTMVVYFHSECKYCQYELNVFNESLHKFLNTRIILLTPVANFFTESKMDSWPGLMNSSKVVWGIVNKKEFRETFGGKGFPSTYIFDTEGILKAKIFGEAKLEKLLSKLRKNPGGPERRVSGL